MKKILVANGIATAREAMARVLTKFGYDVLQVSSGNEILNADPNEFMLVIVAQSIYDISVFDVMRQARGNSRLREIPFILVSSDTHDRFFRQAIEAGFKDLLRAPFNRMSLIGLVNQVLKEHNLVDDTFFVDKESVNVANEKELVEFVKHLIEKGVSTIAPEFSHSINVAYGYPVVSNYFAVKPGEEYDILEILFSESILTRKVVDKVNICPKCNSYQVNFREICPNCQSLNISLENVLHHFKCGYVGPTSDFHSVGDTGFVCPKCSDKLRHIGLDYEKPTDTFVCADCAYVFNEPEVDFECFTCGYVAEAEQVIMRKIYSYSLTSKAYKVGEYNSMAAFEFKELVVSDHPNCVKREFFNFMMRRKHLEAHEYGDTFAVMVLHAEITRQQFDDLIPRVQTIFGSDTILSIDHADVLIALISRKDKNEIGERCKKLQTVIEEDLQAISRPVDEQRMLIRMYKKNDQIDHFLSETLTRFEEHYDTLPVISFFQQETPKRAKNLIFLFLMLLLTACNNPMPIDRHDDHALTQESDHRNLYQRHAITLTNSPDHSENEPKQTQTRYRITETHVLKPLDIESENAEDSYALVSLSQQDQKPVVNIKTELERQEPLSHTFILDRYNARKIEENQKKTVYELFVSLRGKRQRHLNSSLSPKRRHEIFRLKLEREKSLDTWRLLAFDQLTTSCPGGIQPILNHAGDKLAYINTNHGASTLLVYNLETKKTWEIAKAASLPFFIPFTDDLIFVSKDANRHTFQVYDFCEQKIRQAQDHELQTVIRTIPYDSIKSNYMLTADLLQESETMSDIKELEQEFDLKQLLTLWLQNSPAILRDLYKYQAAVSETIYNMSEKDAKWYTRANHLLEEFILVDEGDAIETGDRIASDDFLRLLTGISIPIIPNKKLKQARFSRDIQQQEVYRQRLHKTINEQAVNLIEAYFDYIEWDQNVQYYRRILKLSQGWQKRLQLQAETGFNTKERQFFGDNLLAAAKSEYNYAVEELIHAKHRICSITGLNLATIPTITYSYNPDIPAQYEMQPSLTWFQAHGQINHPDIQRLNAMILRAAAIRDMGPPGDRNEGVMLDINYGLGLEQWTNAVDDFISLSLDRTVSLNMLDKPDAYREQWHQEINSFRQEKHRVQAQIKTDIHEAYKDLDVLILQLLNRIKRRDFYHERVRISKVYNQIGKLESQKTREIHNFVPNEMNYLREAIKVNQIKCDYFRRLIKLYAAAGISGEGIHDIIENNSSSQYEIKKEQLVNGLFLWESIPVVSDRDKRKTFLNFCEEENINQVYCFVSRTESGELYLEKYNFEFKYFLKLCQNQGMRVYALMGNPEWIKPSYQREIRNLLKAYQDFNKSCADDYQAGFSGINLDVEPHALPGWQTPEKQSQLILRYLETLQYIKQSLPSTPIVLDISYKYHGIGANDQREKDLLTRISSYVDRLLIMAYLNRKELILKKVVPILKRADMQQSRIQIAVETAPLTKQNLSFAETSYRNMKETLSSTIETLANYENFTGLVYHDYKHFKDLKHRQSSTKEQ